MPESTVMPSLNVGRELGVLRIIIEGRVHAEEAAERRLACLDAVLDGAAVCQKLSSPNMSTSGRIEPGTSRRRHSLRRGCEGEPARLAFGDDAECGERAQQRYSAPTLVFVALAKNSLTSFRAIGQQVRDAELCGHIN